MNILPIKDIIIVEDFLTSEELNTFNKINYEELMDAENMHTYSLKTVKLSDEYKDMMIEIQARALCTLSDILNTHISIDKAKAIGFFSNNINVIKSGGLMDEHHDEASINAYGVVIYLNDNYNGGELEYTKLGLSLKPKAGMLVIHPAAEIFSHKVNEVKDNDRYTITTFIEKERHAIILE